MTSRVVVSAPATIANLGPGFDIFGLAIAEPADVVEVSSAAEGVRISDISGVGSEKIPRDPARNSATVAAMRVAEMLDATLSAEFSIRKGVKPNGGLGSSGASAAAGAVAANELLGGELTKEQLIEAAAFAEGEVAGAKHYDNVSPAILGGFVVIAGDPPKFVKLSPPEMKIVVAQPDIELPTRKGRQVLPERVKLRDAVANAGRASAMAAAVSKGDLKLFGEQMIDSIAEPARSHLIPGFAEVKRAALEAGALGAAMAGAGPAVFAVLEPEESHEEVAKAMREAFEEAGVGCKTFITSPGRGVEVVLKEE